MQLFTPLFLLSFTALVKSQTVEDITNPEVSGDVANSDGSADNWVPETAVASTTAASGYDDDDLTTTLTESVVSTETSEEHESSAATSSFTSKGNHTIPGILDQSENNADRNINAIAGLFGGLAFAVGSILI